jgi:hypothetical protein
MDEPYATTLATVAAGRAASVAELRRLAGRLEELPLDAVAEVLVLLALTTKPPRLQASDGYRAGCVSSQLSYTRKSEVAARLSRVNQWPSRPSHSGVHAIPVKNGWPEHPREIGSMGKSRGRLVHRRLN